MPSFTTPVHEFNPNHEPAGSGIGGRFASRSGSVLHAPADGGGGARPQEYKSPGARAAAEGKIRQVTPEVFKAALLRNTRAETLSDYSLDDLQGMKLFMLEGGQAGYALKPGGELVNLFNNGGEATAGAGPWLVIHGIEQGGRHGDHFNGYLTGFYRKLGFAEVRREPNWTPGGPDVIYMRFAAGDPATARARYRRDGKLTAETG